MQYRSVVMILLLWASIGAETVDNTEYALADGFKNNLGQPLWGAAGTNFIRASPAAYSDGAYEMAGKDRPNPLDISMAVHAGRSGRSSLFGRNAFQAFYAQLVLDEVASVSSPGCPPEYENMPLPVGHPLDYQTQRPQIYLRSGYDQTTGYVSGAPRQQINLASSFLDGGVIYGTSRVWTGLLRSYSSGELLADRADIRSSFPVENSIELPLFNAPVPTNHELKPVKRLFRLGSSKGHENPFLLALQVIWFRWHNKIARDISTSSHGNLTDEHIFQAARRKVVAHFQKIAVKDWLRTFINGNLTNQTAEALPEYKGYDSRLQPGINQEFLAAMFFRHDFTPAAVWTLNHECAKEVTTGRDDMGNIRDVLSLRLCNNFWDSQDLIKGNLEAIIKGMLYTLGEEENGKFVSDFIEHFYGPYEYSRTDHVASEIQRSRDHGLPDYNTVRQAYGLEVLNNWSTFGGLNESLHSLYGGAQPNTVDVLTGGIHDQSEQVAGMSRLFRLILVDQFTHLRDGDRFWYLKHGMFSENETREIETTTFKDILLATTNIPASQIQDDVFLCQDRSPCMCQPPPNVDDRSGTDFDVCTPLATYNYMKGSTFSFAFTYLGLSTIFPVSFLVLMCMVKKRKVEKRELKKRRSTIIFQNDPNRFAAKEYLGKKSGFREIRGEFLHGFIVIRDVTGRDLRYVSLKGDGTGPLVIHLSSDRDMSLLAIKVSGDIDLILKFADKEMRQVFIKCLERYMATGDANLETQPLPEATLLNEAQDTDARQQLLETFFRAICVKVFEDMDIEVEEMDPQIIEKVIHVKLTMAEFADAMGMQPSSLFVQNMFLLANKDHDEFISFQEFLDLFSVFLKGTAEQKGRLLFNIYDIQKTGSLSRDEFHRMIKSILELAESSDLTDSAVDELVSSMFRYVGLDEGHKMTYKHFHKIFCADEYAATLQATTIAGEASRHAPKIPIPQTLQSRRLTVVNSYSARKSLSAKRTSSVTYAFLSKAREISVPRLSLPTITHRMVPPRSRLGKYSLFIGRFVGRYKWHIFWLALYTFLTAGIFIERAYFFARGREHAGLRRMCGSWVTATIRGSASVIMFTYSSLLVTMCRNTITALRETFLHRYIPFNSTVTFHKYIAVLAMIGTIIHIVTHGINLYCISSQSTVNINCLISEYYTPSHTTPTFHYWAFMTITGLAGVLVTVLISVMYAFATQFSRRKVFKAFWFTHSLYWLVYVLTFLHGMGRMVQAPLFFWYMVGPLILFTIDRLQSISRNKVEIAVTSATLLPSGVLRLIFKRPTTFSYRSGQWVRIACPKLSASEYHPFTLTSAPHEPSLSLHIRAAGPWTNNLHKLYTRAQNRDASTGQLPHLFLDGPFGEGHQDWYNNEVAILVGGGIGVTPFASILKDIAFRSKSGMDFTCKKIYFIWVTRTQRSFEWLVDIIREVENADIKDIVDTHIFVTQLQQNFDVRTTMLYICEQHFHKVEGHSLFTGLKAITHFGRPHFEEFFMAIAQEYKVSQVGVFSCGPGPMTSSVQTACTFMNSLIGPTFTHHSENF